jgi:hypothetical protein
MYAAGGNHLFFQVSGTYPVALSEVWLAIAPGFTQWAPFGYWVYPQVDGHTWDGKTDLTRVAVISADGTYLWFSGSTNTITGRINKGVPSGGDFVPASKVGSGYASPGY